LHDECRIILRIGREISFFVDFFLQESVSAD